MAATCARCDYSETGNTSWANWFNQPWNDSAQVLLCDDCVTDLEDWYNDP